MNFKDFYIKKTKVDFNNINRAMFVELQDIEHLKFNKLTEQFNKLLRTFSVKNGYVMTSHSDSVSMDGNFSDVVKSGQNFIKIVKKWEELKKKHRNLSEKSLIGELLMTEDELEKSGFYQKYPHLK